MYDNTRHTVYNGFIYLYFFAGLVFKIKDLEIRITPKFRIMVDLLLAFRSSVYVLYNG